ncbi:MAG: 4-hydroxy-3-methylbut-2-enyl diphosphate reductase [Spirochaetaceae bacterium]|jgi:4-hydroxy-3-methylbut-2-enyl diphosphate reductase|nr:4-hydroxy-3-methylbut-2-enyl diphosphate reductase [Spirochaetaceae bacterium]
MSGGTVVKRAEALGFCAGVRRTVDLALEAARSRGRPGAGLFTLGPLIHNGRVLRQLEGLGFSVLDEDCLPESLAGAVVVIRAHGAGPDVKAGLLRRGAEVIDATCPKVRKSQLKARSLHEKGFAVFIAGEKNHAEVRGITLFAPGSIVVEDENMALADAETLFSKNNAAKTAIIGQTTISMTEYRAVCAAIRRFFPDITVCNTICGATKARQDALAKLCACADAIVIAGDPASSNTRRLLAIAAEHEKPAWIVRSAADLPPGLDALGTVGLSAGASTPDTLIDEIERTLRGG